MSEMPTLAGLSRWWLQQAQDEIDLTAPKAVEYGSTDLVAIGQTLAQCMHMAVTDQEAAELGVFFYLVGKMARWADAVERRESVSDDTLFDIGVYVRMAQRIRSHGGWPGVRSDPAARDAQALQFIKSARPFIGHYVTVTAAGLLGELDRKHCGKLVLATVDGLQMKTAEGRDIAVDGPDVISIERWEPEGNE